MIPIIWGFLANYLHVDPSAWLDGALRDANVKSIRARRHNAKLGLITIRVEYG